VSPKLVKEDVRFDRKHISSLHSSLHSKHAHWPFSFANIGTGSVQELAHLIDLASQDHGDISDKVFKGSLEGRVCVQRSSFRVHLCRIDRSVGYQILFCVE
jgi:hypothetical protein